MLGLLHNNLIAYIVFLQVLIFSCSGPAQNDQADAGGKRSTGAIQSGDTSSTSPELQSTVRNVTTPKTDSLYIYQVLQRAKKHSLNGHSDSAGILYSDLILELAGRGDTAGLAIINSKLVHAFLRQNNFSLARLSSIRALQYGGIDSAGWCLMLSAIGDAAFEKGNFLIAVKNYEEALQVMKLLNLQENIGPQKFKLARTHSSVGDFAQSNLYTEKAIKSFLKSGDSVNLAECYCIKATNLQRMNQDSAEYYLNLMLRIFQQLPDSMKIVKVLYEKALLFSTNQPEQAKQLFLQSLEYYHRNNNTHCEIMCLHQLGILHARQQAFDEALSLVQKANQLADGSNLIKLKVPLLLLLSAILEKAGHHRQAYETIVQANQLRDSLELTQEYLSSFYFDSDDPNIYTTNRQVNLPPEKTGFWHKASMQKRIILTLIAVSFLAFLVIIFYRKYMYNRFALFFPNNNLKEGELCIEHPAILRTNRLTYRNYTNHTPISNYDELSRKISTLVSERQIFRNRLLSSELFAQEAGINCRQLSLHLKQTYGLTYSQFVKQQRVEYARKLLTETKNEEFKIDLVAFQSGFNNRQSFYEAFKEIAGVSPGIYRKNALKSS